MEQSQVVAAAQVARQEAAKAPEFAYQAVFLAVLNAILYPPFLGSFTATGASACYGDESRK